MGAPQIIWIMIMTGGLVLTMNSHGKPKEGNENAWTTLIALLVQVALLWWGGFFS